MLLSVTAWITVVQRIAFVHRATLGLSLSPRAIEAPERERDVPDTRIVADGRAAGDAPASPRRASDVSSSPQLDAAR